MPTHHLLKGVSLWALIGLHDPVESGLAKAKAAGATVVEAGDFQLTEALAAHIAENNMRLVLQCYPNTADDLAGSLTLAKRHGAMLVNVHAANPHLGHEDATALLRTMTDVAAEAGFPVVFETHRGRITQDLYRTAQLCTTVPDMMINLDVSHFVVAGEVVGPMPHLRPLLDPLLNRTAMIHGRISNGLQIQVDVHDINDQLPQLYRQFWGEAMRRWRLRSDVGSVFVFTPELGPPPYAITRADGSELSDRAAQSELIWSLAELAWRDSARASDRLW